MHSSVAAVTNHFSSVLYDFLVVCIFHLFIFPFLHHNFYKPSSVNVVYLSVYVSYVLICSCLILHSVH